MHVFPFKSMMGDSGPFAFAGFAAGVHQFKPFTPVCWYQFGIEAPGDRLDCMMHVTVQMSAAW
jgi:hypothetical protein